MSAKDTADAILRDFRTSMADSAVYLLVELHEDNMIRLSVLFADERMLGI